MSDLQESVIRHEDIESVPYLDSRKLWTFACGRCLETHPLTGSEWKHLLDAKLIEVSITNEGSMFLLDEDLDECRRECQSSFAFWAALDEMRRDVLIEMVFQLGIDHVRQFHEMLGFIAAKQYSQAAAAGLDSQWHKQTPERAEELMKQLETGT